jgi:hypothetical protein
MLAWSNAHKTDGRVIKEIAIQIAKRPRVLEKLVEVGLLETDGKNYEVHDFLKYQLSAEEMKQRREHISGVRASAGRAGAQKRWGPNGNDHNNQNGNLPSPLPSNKLNGKNDKPIAQVKKLRIKNKAKHSIAETPVSEAEPPEAEADAELGYFSIIGKGIERVLGAMEFERLLASAGAQPLGPRWATVLGNLVPLSRDELRMALNKAKAEGKNGRVSPGLVLRIIERWRGEQPAVMMVPQPGSEWRESRRREDELLALERGRPPVRSEPEEVMDHHVEAPAVNGAEQARAIINSLASKMSIQNGK